MTNVTDTPTKPRIDPHSAANQLICGALVRREVIYCASHLIYELAQDDKYSDELLEVMACKDWKSATLESDEWGELSSEEKDDLKDSEEWEDFCAKNDIEPYVLEAFEHWIVTHWLADELEARGEMILRGFMGFEAIWGRACSGQAILLDGVIGEIAAGMEILEGQRNQWKV